MNRPAPYAENRVGASHTLDPSTSREAAALNYPRSGSQREQVLKALAGQGTRGATFQELQGLTGIESAAKRLTELKRDGWAYAADRRRPTRSGATAEVYVVSSSALQELERDRRADQTAGGESSASFHDAEDVRDHPHPSGRGSQPSAVSDQLVGFDAAIEVGGTSHRKGPYSDVYEDAA